MQKSVGFRRDIKASWFDAAASLRTQTEDLGQIRQQLDKMLMHAITGDENRSITIQILLRIWAKPEQRYIRLHEEALDRFAALENSRERIWLHYGMSLLTYPFFRDASGYAGTILRQRGVITNAMLKERIIAHAGQLGSLENASKAVMFALRQWEVIVPGTKRGEYIFGEHLITPDKSLEGWLIKTALCSRDAETAIAQDLFSWASLFPFGFSITTYDLREVPGLEIQRQGSNLDVLGLTMAPST
jgi:hypothetical protein